MCYNYYGEIAHTDGNTYCKGKSYYLLNIKSVWLPATIGILRAPNALDHQHAQFHYLHALSLGSMDAEMDMFNQVNVSLAVARAFTARPSLTEDLMLRPQHALDAILPAMSVQVQGQGTAYLAKRTITSPILIPQIKCQT